MGEFLLLELLPAVVSAGLGLRTIGGREDHIIYEFGDARTVSIRQNLRDDALQKSFVLKFDIFLVLGTSFFLIFEFAREVFLVGTLLLGFGIDEAVEVGRRGIKFEGRIVLLE